MKKTVTFEVEVTGDVSNEDIKEYIEFMLERDGCSVDNPLLGKKSRKATISYNNFCIEDTESIKKRLLTDDEMSTFLSLELISNADELFEQLKSARGGCGLKAIEKRFEAYEMNVDKKVMIAVLSIGDGVIGKCTKYVDDIADWCNKFHHTKIDWNRFTKEVYPLGVPIF